MTRRIHILSLAAVDVSMRASFGSLLPDIGACMWLDSVWKFMNLKGYNK